MEASGLTEGIPCSRGECPGQGTWIPVIMLKSERGDVTASLPELGSCEMHKSATKLEDFLSPEGWDKITKHLREAGKGTFVRRSTHLTWRRSEDPSLLPF